jgi:hypothetical protein
VAEGPSPVPGPREPSLSNGDERFDFQDCTEEEIEHICQVFHFAGGGAGTALDKIEDELLFESSSDIADEDWDGLNLFRCSAQGSLVSPERSSYTVSSSQLRPCDLGIFGA